MPKSGDVAKQEKLLNCSALTLISSQAPVFPKPVAQMRLSVLYKGLPSYTPTHVH